MKTPQEIEMLAWDRLDEAKVLFENRKFDGAFYLAGYAVELMLKARICKLFDIPNLFDETNQSANLLIGIGEMRRAVKTHHLQVLLAFSGLKKKFDLKMTTDTHFFTVYSELFCRWSEQVRYYKTGTTDETELRKTFEALGNKTQGVLQWLSAN